MKNDTSASNAVLLKGRCQTLRICAMRFCRYSGYGNSTPSVLTDATSVPVLGFSPGSGVTGVGGPLGGASCRVSLAVFGTGAGLDFVVFDLSGAAGAVGSERRSSALEALRMSG